MTKELGAVFITEKSLKRSITGHIIREVFSGGVKPLELLEARMYAPSEKLIREYIKLIVEEPFKDYLKREYIEKNRGPWRKRIMLLLFKGEDAISQIKGIVGHISKRIDGTIRNSFAEFIEDKDGEITGFLDPAVIIIPDKEHAKDVVSLWAEYSESEGGLLSNLIDWKILLSDWSNYEYDALKHREGVALKPEEILENIQQTLILIKPDNIYTKSRRVGAIIDALSGPGLKMIGVKAVNMSIEQAVEFYKPIEGKLIKNYGEQRGKKEFAELVRFMTGYDPYEVTALGKRKMPGSKQQQSLALVYQGPFAVERIRKKVGATDPLEAEPGTIRREYGHDIMKNGVHASDSLESAEREIKIVDIQGTALKKIVKEAFA
jgi:nucleoside diphosphate kinase